MKTALSIAGSDSSGGAGIQADLKTFLANGVYGMSAITAITAQNTMGVDQIDILSPEILEGQIRSVFEDIYPDAVKIGMVGNEASIEVIAKLLQEYEAKNIVIDPVMVTTSGSSLFEQKAASTYYDVLFPLAAVITPNISEAETISQREIKDETSMEEAGKEMYERFGVPILVKGGHLTGDPIDILVDADAVTKFKGNRINNPNTHGTGCTLSSAIASNLAKGNDLVTSIQDAKDYVSGVIVAGLNLGKGSGPLNHGYNHIVRGKTDDY